MWSKLRLCLATSLGAAQTKASVLFSLESDLGHLQSSVLLEAGMGSVTLPSSSICVATVLGEGRGGILNGYFSKTEKGMLYFNVLTHSIKIQCVFTEERFQEESHEQLWGWASAYW